jgi:PAS domain S-box-containing protein
MKRPTSIVISKTSQYSRGSLFDRPRSSLGTPSVRWKATIAKNVAVSARKVESKAIDEASTRERERELPTTHDAVRQSQRIASQLHQLIAASITVATLRNEPDILRSLARSSRTVFDADEVFVSLDSGPAAPLRGIARRGKRPVSEVPTDPESSQYPNSSERGYETFIDDEWLVSPIMKRRDHARGVIAVRRALAFNEEDKEVAALLAQMASSALGAVELGRSVESSEARLRVLIETAPVGIVEADIDGHVRWWNHAASSVFAWPEYDERTVGNESRFPEATLPELRELWSEVLRGGLVDGRDFVDVEIAGKMRVLSASAALLPTTGAESPGILTLIDDVTNHRELKAELRHAYTMEIRGQVASRIAHDFNNLITLISGYAEILSSDLGDNERARQMVNEIQSTASRASMLTTQLQAIGRTRDPELVVFNPVTFIQSNAEVLDRILGSTIDVRFELDVRAANVRVDADQFEQMILNLAINARDAMAHGGELVISVSPVVLDHDDADSFGLVAGEYVRVTFTDNGVGMDDETRARCFDPLFTTKGPFKGTGMGLAAARRLAEESHGAILCRSKQGEGTTFEVTFPTVSDEVEESLGLVVPERPRGSATILVVDDDEELRRFMSRILERNGYRIFEADSAEGALRVVEEFEGTFDLLVSDVVMGEMSGRDLATSLQVQLPGLGVLLVSGTATRTILKDLDSASSDFLAKPFKPSDLVDRVHGLLARRS